MDSASEKKAICGNATAVTSAAHIILRISSSAYDLLHLPPMMGIGVRRTFSVRCGLRRPLSRLPSKLGMDGLLLPPPFRWWVFREGGTFCTIWGSGIGGGGGITNTGDSWWPWGGGAEGGPPGWRTIRSWPVPLKPRAIMMLLAEVAPPLPLPPPSPADPFPFW